MHRIDDETQILDPGDADSYAQWFYAALDPLTHIDAYRRDVAISFRCGAADRHVPADGAVQFRKRLIEEVPGSGERIKVDIHPGLSHIDGGSDERLCDNAVSWLARG